MQSDKIKFLEVTIYCTYCTGKGQRLAANGIVQVGAEKCVLANITS